MDKPLAVAPSPISQLAIFKRFLLAGLPSLGGLILACIAVTAHGDTLSGQPCSRLIKVAISPIGRSMMVSDKGGVTGIVRDFLDLVSQRSGCAFDYQPVPRARAFAMLEKGDIDIVPSANRTDQRDQWGKFIHLYNNRPMLVSLKATPPSTLAQLVDGSTSICVVRGYDYGPAYAAFVGDPRMQSRVSPVRDPEICARMLVMGRIDAVLIAPSAFVEAAMVAGIVDKVLVTPVTDLPFAPTGLYFAQRRVDAADRTKVETAIDFLVKHGEYRRLLEKYYASTSWALGNLESTVADPQNAP